jgi:sortase (surface protein transpeptidase)
MISAVANNTSGDTFIYGHNNDYVFGAFRHITPTPGATAFVYTANGHIFDYTFDSSLNLSPDDTSILTYQGPPVLTIQTCTGSVNEWRTMYRFNFDKVVV